MYGNYEEGFDPVLAAAKSTVIYKERLQDLVTFDLVAEPIVAPNGAGSSTGFVLSTEGLPEVINEGLYEININMTPRRNLHVFNTHNSYKPSRHITLSGETDMSGTNLILQGQRKVPHFLPHLRKMSKQTQERRLHRYLCL